VARVRQNGAGIDFPLQQMVTCTLTDAILVALVVAERQRPATHTFARMLPPFVLAQLPTFAVTRIDAWTAFAQALGRISR